MQSADPSQHLRLIHRVINQMGLKGDLAEEAFSEGLVAITEAAQSFDPTYNVPLANWLGRNIRWSIQTWLGKEKRSWGLEPQSRGSSFPAEEDVEDITIDIERSYEVKEALEQLEKILEKQEKEILILHILGYPGVQIAKKFGITPVQVTRIKQRAQKKLQKAREGGNLSVSP